VRARRAWARCTEVIRSGGFARLITDYEWRRAPTRPDRTGAGRVAKRTSGYALRISEDAEKMPKIETSFPVLFEPADPIPGALL